MGKDKEGVFRLMEDDCSNKWLVLVLKDKFSNDFERESLKDCLMLNFPLKSTDIYYVRSEDCFACNNFLFVREYDSEDLRRILEFKRDAFEPYPMHMRITNEEMTKMVKGINMSRKVVLPKHGDIVFVKSGKYGKLYGMVLRECRSFKVIVGFKFCFGIVLEQYEPDEFSIVGNLFNYLKVLK